MPGINALQDHAPRPHCEYICHATGEQRQNILNQLKMLLDSADDRPCLVPEPVKTNAYNRPLMKYPGYIDPHHPNNQPPPQHHGPLITGSGLQEIRPTSELDRVSDDPPNLMYKHIDDFARQQQEAREQKKGKDYQLKGGVFYSECECLKRNGLQDQCPLTECMGKPECTSVPTPTCSPALAHQEKSHKGGTQKHQDNRRPAPELCDSGKPGTIVCCCCHKC